MNSHQWRPEMGLSPPAWPPRDGIKQASAKDGAAGQLTQLTANFP